MTEPTPSPWRVMMNAPGGIEGTPALVGDDGYAVANGDPEILTKAAKAMNAHDKLVELARDVADIQRGARERSIVVVRARKLLEEIGDA